MRSTSSSPQRVRSVPVPNDTETELGEMSLGDERAVAVLESTIVRRNCVRICWELVMNAILDFLKKTIHTVKLDTKQCNVGNSLAIQGNMETLQNGQRRFLG